MSQQDPSRILGTRLSTRMTRRRLLELFCTGAGAIGLGSLIGCSSPSTPTNPSSIEAPAPTRAPAATLAASSPVPPTRKPKGQIVEAENLQTFDDMNPITTNNAGHVAHFGSVINEPLVDWNRDDLSPTPRLAEKWEISSDGRVYTFYIRKGVNWSDGKPFTAEDARFTFEAARKPENGYLGESLVKSITEIKVVDPYVLAITLDKPTPPFLGSILTFNMIPRHLLEGQDMKKHRYSTIPVGTGPYTVTEHSADFIVLSANPNYWGEPAKLEKIILKAAPDTNARAALLRSGEVDLSRYEFATMADLVGKGFQTSLAEGFGYFTVLLNLQNPLFSDLKVRQAMMLAMDRENMVKTAGNGLATVASGYLSPKSWAYTDKVTKYSYDLAKAQQLLAEAGWKKNDKGVLEKDGKPFSIMLLNFKPSQGIYQTGLILQQNWKSLGMQVDMDVAPDFTVWTEQAKAGKFDVSPMSFSSGFDPGAEARSANFYSSAPWNVGKYSNKELDRLLDEGLVTLDIEKRKEIYAKVQQIMADDLPWLWIWWSKGGIIFKDSVKGARATPLHSFWGTIRDWYKD